MPPEKDDKSCWPAWPRKLRTSTSHEEGCERLWEASTKEILLNDKGEVRGVRCVKLKWSLGPDGRFTPSEVPDSAFEIPCQRVLLAMGFMHPAAATLKSFGVETDARGNAKAGVDGSEAPFATSVPGVFACGNVLHVHDLVDNVSVARRARDERGQALRPRRGRVPHGRLGAAVLPAVRHSG